MKNLLANVVTPKNIVRGAGGLLVAAGAGVILAADKIVKCIIKEPVEVVENPFEEETTNVNEDPSVVTPDEE